MSDLGRSEPVSASAATKKSAAPLVAVRNSVAAAGSKAGSDVESFLDSTGLPRKLLVFQRNEVILWLMESARL